MRISQAKSTITPEELIPDDLTYQLPMNIWCLDKMQQSILEQGTLFC